MENKKYDLEKAKEDCRRHEDALEEAQSCMCGHCHECVFDPEEMLAALDEIDQQAKQISALKEKLVESQAAINSLSLPLGMDPIDLGIDWSEGELEAARQQLKAEMKDKGVEWE